MQFQSSIYQPREKKAILLSFRQIVCLVQNTKRHGRRIGNLALTLAVANVLLDPGLAVKWPTVLFSAKTWQVAIAHQFELVCFDLQLIVETVLEIEE